MKAKISRVCGFCDEVFLVWPYKIKDGGGLFCSRVCVDTNKRNDLSLTSLLSQTTPRGDCLEWTRARFANNYGMVNGGAERLVHRLVYMVANSVVLTRSDVIRHTCDNPPCCNPEHLRLGTRRDNIDDMLERGRQLMGSRNPAARLSEDDVVAIRVRLADGDTQVELSQEYAVSRRTIRDIGAYRTWQHIDRDGQRWTAESAGAMGWSYVGLAAAGRAR